MPASLAHFNWEIIFYFLAVYGAVCYFRPVKSEDLPPGKVNWRPLETLAISVGIYFAGQFLGSVLGYLYPLLRHWNATQTVHWLEHDVTGQFVLIASVYAVMVGLLYIFLRRRRADFRTIGLHRPRWADPLYSCAGFVVYFGLYLGGLFLVKQLAPSINLNQSQQLGFQNPHTSQLPLVFISLVILPPLAEEIMVRGFLYSGLKNGLKLWLAVVLTSIVFGLAHLEVGSGAPLLWVAALDTFILSLVLIYLKEKTGSLWASIGLHMLKNGVAFISLFLLK